MLIAFLSKLHRNSKNQNYSSSIFLVHFVRINPHTQKYLSLESFSARLRTPPPPPPPRQTHSIAAATHQPYIKQFQLPAAPLDPATHFPVLKIEEDFDNGMQAARHDHHAMHAYARKMTTTSPWTSNESILRSPGNVDEDNKSSASSSSACDETRAALSSGKSGQLLPICLSARNYARVRSAGKSNKTVQFNGQKGGRQRARRSPVGVRTFN